MKESKLYIMTTKKVSGIYTITNMVTGKLYIGESLDIYRRWHDEYIPELRKNRHYNKELQKDFNKYGEENFSFEILEQYSRNDPISTKARILILESYFITQFEKAGISLYNAENTLVEILNGNKIPEAGNTLIYAMVNVLANYTIKECEGFAYFEKYRTIKDVLFEHIDPPKGLQASILNEFEKYIENQGFKKYYYIHANPVHYVVNGKKLKKEEYVVRDDKVKELEKMAILFSEHRSKVQEQEELSADRKSSDKVQYEPIKDGEVKFSLLFKEFAEKGILPKDYIYDKVREYMADLGLIEMKEIESNGASRRATFVTADALNKKILRIVASKMYGDTLTYNYVFTVDGIEYMRKIFSGIDENKKMKLFTYMNVA